MEAGKHRMTTRGRATIGARRREPDASDLLGSYLTEIGAYELLTAGEEVALARAIRCRVEALERIDEAGPEERRDLEAAIERGRRAQLRFVRSNLRLVVSVARKYARGGMEMLDLIQEGNVGLMRAVERFDPDRGFRFSTYGIWWIRQSIRRAVSQTSSTIRIPEHVRGRLGRLRAAEEVLRSELGRDPSMREIAEAAGLDVEEADRLRDLPDSVSFETPIGGEGGSELGDFLADMGSTGPSESAVEASMQADVRTALATLRERDRRLLELRFGLEEGGGRTLEEIAKELGVSRQRVRQIEQRALARLREVQGERLEVYS